MDLDLWHWVALAEAVGAVALAVFVRGRGSVFRVAVWTVYLTQAITLIVFAAGTPPNIYFPLFVLPAAFLVALRFIEPLFVLKLYETDDEKQFRYRTFPSQRRKRLDEVKRF